MVTADGSKAGADGPTAEGDGLPGVDDPDATGEPDAGRAVTDGPEQPTRAARTSKLNTRRERGIIW
jgi:hypothetical protein